jgi:hypothetical protein
MRIRLPYLRGLLFFSFLMLSMRAVAPVLNIVYIDGSEAINPYDRLLKAVLRVESSGDTLAYNIIEEAVGGLQIRPIRLLDYNQRTGKNYKLADCYNFRISKEIFFYYASQYGTTDYESIARSWNGSGIATIDYWAKVRALL